MSRAKKLKIVAHYEKFSGYELRVIPPKKPFTKYVFYSYLYEAIRFAVKPFVRKIEIAGSLRRGVESPGDIDIVVIMKSKKRLADIRDFLTSEFGFTTNWCGDIKMQVQIDDLKVDFVATTKNQWGACMLYFTGSGQFNMRMRANAKRRGLRLNEYGLWRGNDLFMSGTEKMIFTELGMNYLKPNERS